MLPFVPAIAAALATAADGQETRFEVGYQCDFQGRQNSAKILEIDAEKGKIKISAYNPNEGTVVRWVRPEEISNCKPPPRARQAPAPEPPVWHKLSCGDWTADPPYASGMAKCRVCRSWREVAPTTERGPRSYYGPVGTCSCKTCRETPRT